MGLIRRYLDWLHEGVPTGGVEFYPERAADGRSSQEGIYIAGDRNPRERRPSEDLVSRLQLEPQREGLRCLTCWPDW